MPTMVLYMHDHITHFVGFCLLLEDNIYCGSALRGEFRHSEVYSESNIHHKLKNSDIIAIPAAPCLPHACSLLGQWF